VPGGDPAAAVPVTTALSNRIVPRSTGLFSGEPRPLEGVVTVVVAICRTMKHSDCPVPTCVLPG
jgi:hypothetical protein